MRPGNIRPDELPEEQRRRDRSGEGRIAGIVDVGRLAVEEAPIGLPERQAPERIVLVAGRLLERGGKFIVVTEHRRQVRTERHTRGAGQRSEEHTSELQSLMRISYAVFCLNKK